MFNLIGLVLNLNVIKYRLCYVIRLFEHFIDY
jgi:hypothetical protein